VHSLTPQFLDRLRLNAADGSSLASLGQARGKQELFRRQTPDLLATLREAAMIESAESSNRIEGVTAPADRIEALVLKRTTPRDRSEQEIAGYRDALDLIHQSAKEMAFSVNIILQLHTMLYRYRHYQGPGGRWKMTSNEIVEKDASGRVVRVRFKPPEPIAVPQMMADLQTNYARAIDTGREPLIVVPLAILDFLCIHPFGDGNGRTSRLLTLQLLYHFDLEVGRYISLERTVEESKETYYEALERSSRGWNDGEHDPMPWLRYFWGVLYSAYREFENRVGTLRIGKGAKTDMVEQAVARRMGSFTISDIEADSPGVTRDWVRIVLRRLKREGRIALIGRGRGAKWKRTEQ
jgi:Fic family protein